MMTFMYMRSGTDGTEWGGGGGGGEEKAQVRPRNPRPAWVLAFVFKKKNKNT